MIPQGILFRINLESVLVDVDELNLRSRKGHGNDLPVLVGLHADFREIHAGHDRSVIAVDETRSGGYEVKDLLFFGIGLHLGEVVFLGDQNAQVGQAFPDHLRAGGDQDPVLFLLLGLFRDCLCRFRRLPFFRHKAYAEDQGKGSTDQYDADIKMIKVPLDEVHICLLFSFAACERIRYLPGIRIVFLWTCPAGSGPGSGRDPEAIYGPSYLIIFYLMDFLLP